MEPETIVCLVWLGLLLGCAAGEALTVGLTSIWCAAGALAGLICALAGGPLWLQVALFVVVAVLCLRAVRPLAKRHLNSRVVATNADRVIGARAQVSEDIQNVQGRGAVKIGGVTWSARSEDGADIPAGTAVRVLRIEGVKVFVAPVEAAPEQEPSEALTKGNL
ncbi:MAG: NfeD family protein [Oscillospiraceae bacterium]|nr:NfeD family protein [Oscillospiraceae bacterium]